MRFVFFFSSRRRHTRLQGDWSSDVCSSDLIGRAVVAMGGGRLAVDDAVDPTVGFVITVKPGDKIPGGEPIASVFAKDPAGIKLGFEALQQAIAIGDKLTEKPLPLISHRVTKAGVEQLKR